MHPSKDEQRSDQAAPAHPLHPCRSQPLFVVIGIESSSKGGSFEHSSYVAASFYYEDGHSCSLSSGTAALNCASFVPTTCNSTFVWNSRSTCSNCMSSAAVVDSLAGVVSFS